MSLKGNLKKKTPLKKKVRLDQYLVNLKYFDSKNQAQRVIMSGHVLVDDKVILKSGFFIDPNSNIKDKIRIKETLKYVSRAGFKLEKAIKQFKINCKDKTCLDIGSSTGGFSDCLLQEGAKNIIAVDVGTNQLHYKIRINKKVSVYEKTNAKFLSTEIINTPIDILVMDVSFISIKKIFDVIYEVMRKNYPIDYQAVFLIKPQFEGKASQVEKGGLVKNPLFHLEILNGVLEYFSHKHCLVKGLIPSPIKGTKGNIEYLLWVEMLEKSKDLKSLAFMDLSEDVERIVNDAFNSKPIQI